MGPFMYEIIAPDVVLASARNRTQEPSLSHSLLRFGCLDGTFSPSCLHSLSTRLGFTFHPSP